MLAVGDSSGVSCGRRRTTRLRVAVFVSRARYFVTRLSVAVSHPLTPSHSGREDRTNDRDQRRPYPLPDGRARVGELRRVTESFDDDGT